MDGAEICGDIVTRGAVAPRGAVIERAMTVDNAGGDSIDLGFDRDGDMFGAEVLLQALVKVFHFLSREDVVDGEHGNGMTNLLEALQRGSPHALGRRVRIIQFRMGGLEILQLTEDLVVFRIRNLGCGFHVVE